jgi:hypothetical protein
MGYKEDFERARFQEKLSKVILLPEEEKVISTWVGVRCTLAPPYRGLKEYPGQLYLTSQRLIWIQNGTFFFDLPLEELISISLVDWRIPRWGPYYPPTKRISIKSTSSKNINEFFKLNYGAPYGKLEDRQDPFIFEEIKKTIEEATQNRTKEIHQEKTSKRIQVVLDFSGLKKTIEKGGIILTTFKCPSCNAMLPIPYHGKLLICEYCNVPIKATDIFEKIKSLLE